MKVKTFNVSIPEGLLKKADAVAKREYRSRSELIRESLRKYIQDMEEWDAIMEYGQKKVQNKSITTEEDINKIVQEVRHGKKK